MAMLAQEIPARKARKLGEAYEKGNYRQFRKGKLEDGAMQDQAASRMDLRNNNVGIHIGTRAEMTENELIDTVAAEILKGNFFKIAQRSNVEMFDCRGKMLAPEEWQGKWENDRCIVPSNFDIAAENWPFWIDDSIDRAK